MLEKTFEKFLEKKHPEVIELLRLAKMEQEKRQKLLEESMLKFSNSLKNDVDVILNDLVDKKLKEHGLIE